jgi:hypothetical protein
LNLTRAPSARDAFKPPAPSLGRGALLYRLGHRREHGRRQDRGGPGSLIYEPFGLLHLWGNPGSEPLTFLAFNINPEGVPAVIPETPAKP